jgi:hypothetical protein
MTKPITYAIPLKVKDSQGKPLKTYQGEQLYWCKDGSVTLYPRVSPIDLHPNVEVEYRETEKP